MGKTVFVSHAGSESDKAREIAGRLQQVDISVRFDRKELELGDSFLSFMEDALLNADYCLLLWSKAASRQKWVQVEWEAALYRSIQESRSFIIVGRLEPFPVPSLLGPRLMVELFPEHDPGFQQLIHLWQDDRNAEAVSSKPVASSEAFGQIESGNETVYITSDLFGITVPVKLDLHEPIVVIINRIVHHLKLPKDISYNNLIGLRLEYNLVHEDKILDKNLCLADQQVRANQVIWLETKATQYAQATPYHNENRSSGYKLETYETNIYRNVEPWSINHFVQKSLFSIIQENKLGFIEIV
ncbi:MAG: toll/interleukin-1 receptor domain-containing protein [Chitinophagaceae bacterium]